MNDTRQPENDTRLTARQFVRAIDSLEPGWYSVTRYGKPWRSVLVMAAGTKPAPESVPAPPLKTPGPASGPAAVPLVAGRPLKANPAMARFLASQQPGPAASQPDQPAPEPEPMTKRAWAKLSPDARARHVAPLKLRDNDELADYLASLPR